MKTLWLLPALFLLACAPAHAATPAPPGCFPLSGSNCHQPGGGSFAAPSSWCSWGVCYTRDASEIHMESFQVDQLGNLALAGGWYRRVDTNQQGQPSSIGCGIIFYPPVQPYGYAPCVPVSGYFVSHLYARYHPYRKDRPYSSGTIATFRALDGIETQKSLSSLSTMSDPTANTPDCHSYEVPDGMGGFKQAPDAPLEIVPICWPVDETVDPGTTDPVGGGDAGDDTAPKPEEAAACRSVKARGQTIMIRRTRSNCKVAQGIVRSYVARGREPAKWICVTAASGKSRVARCAYIGRTAIIVTGRWRVR